MYYRGCIVSVGNCSTTVLTVKVFFLLAVWTSHIHYCSSSCHAPLWTAGLSSWWSLYRSGEAAWRSLQSLPFSRLKKPVPSASPHRSGAPGPWASWCLSAKPAPIYCCVSYIGGREQNCSILDMVCWVAGDKNFPHLLLFIHHAPVHKVQDSVGRLRCQGTLPAHAQLALHQDAQVLSRELLRRLSVPNLSHCQGLFLPRCRTQHLFLLNFTRFLSAHFSSLSRSTWTAALTLSLSICPPICPLQTWWECILLPPQGCWSRELLAVKFIFTIISESCNLVSLINFISCISITFPNHIWMFWTTQTAVGFQQQSNVVC